MVDWLNQELQQEARELATQSAIKEQAPAVYDELWQEILNVVNSPAARRFQLRTNGGPRNRKVLMDNRELRIALAPDNAGISAIMGAKVLAAFHLRADKDNVVHLVAEGKRIDYPKAAEMAMKPFIFLQLDPP